MAKLVVLTEGLAGMTHELGGKWVTIGRAHGNTFQIDETSVSGRHCEVRLRGDELVVRDLCSTNGTFLQGQKITEAVLKPGQTLQVGEVRLRFEASDPTVAPSAPFSNRMLIKSASPKTAPSDSKPVPPPEPGDKPTKKHQVLFVDDSLAFIETFSELCSVLVNETWEIHTATSADLALAILQQSRIDLVVVDIGMPLVDGIQLLGIIARRYPGVKIAVLTGKDTQSNRAACLAGGADLYIEKPVSAAGNTVVFNMLNDLVSWAHREGFSGTLRQVGLQEVIQMECIGRRSSILEIRNQQMLGEIYIETGAVTHATVGDLVGDEAFNRLLSLTGGEFRLKPFKPPPQRTVEERWETLLMEAARRSDEETVLVADSGNRPTEPPAFDPDLTAPVPASTESEHPDLGEDLVVVAIYEGKWHPVDGTKR